ncbi:MAG TPA: heparinase II/III family protein [archaeon]|nr:heparinase II/III family protein [archaeon]
MNSSVGFRLSAALMIFAFLSFPLQGRALDIYPEHPRLFFRAQAWSPRGLTLQILKERIRLPGAGVVLEKLESSPPNLALKSILLDDRNAARQAIESLVQPIPFDGTTSDGILVGWAAMAYDWLYHDPDFTQAQKALAREQIASGARQLIRQLESGAHIFHTRMYGWAMGIAMAGLALYGEHPEAERFALYGGNYFKERLFPARKLQDGSVHNSFGYGRKYTMWLTGHFISSWYSATGENLWEDIRTAQDDWARKEILFNIYGRYPDKSYLRFGDSYSLLSDHYTFRAVSERTWAYGDSTGAGFLNLLVSEDDRDVVEKSSAYVYFLFYDPGAPAVPHTTLPLKVLFSPKGTGMVVWKSAWAQDGTTVFFKCGNYFGDHGHFDQGHLDIFRRAPLLIDSGAYLTFSGPFRMEYWHKTVAHNTVLVVDPAVEDDEGGQRIFHSQSDATIARYLANEKAETGEILDYRVENGLAYVAGDITAAYPADRVRRVTRELAFVADRYLVVVDRVMTARPGLVPKVLWHCPVLPEIDEQNRRFEVSRSGARVIVSTLLPGDSQLDWVEGFRVGRRNIPPEGTLKGLPDMGVGRVEVCGAQDHTEFLFVHVIDIADNSDSPGRTGVEESPGAIRVTAGERSVSFKAASPGLVR